MRKGRREGEVLAGILQYLESRGDVFVWRNNTGGYSPRPGAFVRFGFRGSADLLGCIAPTGKLIAFEVKREIGGKLSPEQERFGENVVNHGGVYAVVRSIEDVQRALGEPTVRVQKVQMRNRVFPK